VYLDIYYLYLKSILKTQSKNKINILTHLENSSSLNSYFFYQSEEESNESENSEGIKIDDFDLMDFKEEETMLH